MSSKSRIELILIGLLSLSMILANLIRHDYIVDEGVHVYGPFFSMSFSVLILLSVIYFANNLIIYRIFERHSLRFVVTIGLGLLVGRLDLYGGSLFGELAILAILLFKVFQDRLSEGVLVSLAILGMIMALALSSVLPVFVVMMSLWLLFKRKMKDSIKFGLFSGMVATLFFLAMSQDPFVLKSLEFSKILGVQIVCLALFALGPSSFSWKEKLLVLISLVGVLIIPVPYKLYYNDFFYTTDYNYAYSIPFFWAFVFLFSDWSKKDLNCESFKKIGLLFVLILSFLNFSYFCIEHLAHISNSPIISSPRTFWLMSMQGRELARLKIPASNVFIPKKGRDELLLKAYSIFSSDEDVQTQLKARKEIELNPELKGLFTARTYKELYQGSFKYGRALKFGLLSGDDKQANEFYLEEYLRPSLRRVLFDLAQDKSHEGQELKKELEAKLNQSQLNKGKTSERK